MKRLQATWALRTDGKTVSDDLKEFRNQAFTKENFLEFLESGMTQDEWVTEYIRNQVWLGRS